MWPLINSHTWGLNVGSVQLNNSEKFINLQWVWFNYKQFYKGSNAIILFKSVHCWFSSVQYQWFKRNFPKLQECSEKTKNNFFSNISSLVSLLSSHWGSVLRACLIGVQYADMNVIILIPGSEALNDNFVKFRVHVWNICTTFTADRHKCCLVLALCKQTPKAKKPEAQKWVK